MAIFHFFQFEHELFWRYFKCLNIFLDQCGYHINKHKILDIVHKGVNSKTRIRLEYWDFHGKNVDDALYLLEWIAWDSFEFEKASCVSRYSFLDPCAFYCRSYYAPFGVICVIPLTILLVRVLIMHAMISLTLYHLGTILMLSYPYLTRPSL